MAVAKLFRNGSSQAVRLPKEFVMPGREGWVRRVGAAVLLVPIDDASGGLEAALGAFSEDFLAERVQPMVDERETL